jgi:hypothetical protein
MRTLSRAGPGPPRHRPSGPPTTSQIAGSTHPPAPPPHTTPQRARFSPHRRPARPRRSRGRRPVGAGSGSGRTGPSPGPPEGRATPHPTQQPPRRSRPWRTSRCSGEQSTTSPAPTSRHQSVQDWMRRRIQPPPGHPQEKRNEPRPASAHGPGQTEHRKWYRARERPLRRGRGNQDRQKRQVWASDPATSNCPTAARQPPGTSRITTLNPQSTSTTMSSDHPTAATRTPKPTNAQVRDLGVRLWRRRDSNPQPPPCKGGALPIALLPRARTQRAGKAYLAADGHASWRDSSLKEVAPPL